jgi:DNA polymerase-4
VGRAAAEVLRRHGVMTIGMLAAVPRESLVRWLGKQGESLHAMANGLDDTPVRRWGESEMVKSVGNGMTYPHDLLGEEAWHAGLMPLCDSVGSRLRAQHLKCRTITVQIKDPQFKVISRQKTLPMPTSLTKVLFQESLAIMRQCWPKDAPIRLLTVTASSLCREDEQETAQLSFLTDVKPDDPRQARIEQAVDGVRQRFGRSAVSPGANKVE